MKFPDPGPNKRITVVVYPTFSAAHRLQEYLKRAGLDAKIVTRHAVQVHPKDRTKLEALPLINSSL